jgi:hypothetical protein
VLQVEEKAEQGKHRVQVCRPLAAAAMHFRSRAHLLDSQPGVRWSGDSLQRNDCS